MKNLHIFIQQRAFEEALYILDKKTTIRGVAKGLNIPKTTVHKDLTKTLKELDINIYNDVKEILKTNKDEKHIRGGEATKQKYLKRKKYIYGCKNN